MRIRLSTVLRPLPKEWSTMLLNPFDSQILCLSTVLTLIVELCRWAELQFFYRAGRLIFNQSFGWWRSSITRSNNSPFVCGQNFPQVSRRQHNHRTFAIRMEHNVQCDRYVSKRKKYESPLFFVCDGVFNGQTRAKASIFKSL